MLTWSMTYKRRRIIAQLEQNPSLSIEQRSYSKTCEKRQLTKRPKIGFQDQLSLNAGHKHCRMLQGEHSAILSTFIKLPFVIKIFVLSILSGRFTQVLHRFYYIFDLISVLRIVSEFSISITIESQIQITDFRLLRRKTL